MLRLARFIRAQFASGRLARSAVILASGTVVGQAINALAAPALTRLYDPSTFGRGELFAVFVNVAVVGAAFRYDAAIVTARTRRSAAYVALLCCGFIAVSSVIASAILYAACSYSLFGYGNLPAWSALLVAAAIPAASFAMVLRFWLVREQNFIPISRVAAIQQGARASTQLLLGVGRIGLTGLLFGELAGRAAGMTSLVRIVYRDIRDALLPFRFRRLRRMAMTFRKFPLVSLPSSLLDILGLYAALPLVAYLYGTDAAGYYALMQRILSAPASLVAGSVADVFHARLAQLARTRPVDARTLFLRTAGAIGLAGAIPVFLIMLIAPYAIPLLFGARWAPSAALVVMMVPSTLALVIVTTLSRAVFVYQAQETKLMADIVNLTVPTGTLWFCHSRGWPLPRAVGAMSFSAVGAYCFYFVLLLSVVARASRRRLPVDAARTAPSPSSPSR